MVCGGGGVGVGVGRAGESYRKEFQDFLRRGVLMGKNFSHEEKVFPFKGA